MVSEQVKTRIEQAEEAKSSKASQLLLMPAPVVVTNVHRHLVVSEVFAYVDGTYCWLMY